MSRLFFQQELEGAATFWRIYRGDGVTLGFTSHDRDLWFGGILHRAAPGMIPSSIRRTSGLSNDSAEVEGALTHDAINAADLSAGRFDGARFAIGLVDWETLEHTLLFHGEAGAMVEEEGKFSTELQSAKAALLADLVPRTSPTCRAQFCGKECNLSPLHFTHELTLTFVDHELGLVQFAGGPSPDYLTAGYLRWFDGPHAGITMQIMRSDANGQLLDQPLSAEVEIGMRVMLREGCDHTWASCSGRFDNAANFRGEPFLPGNDLLARYPSSSS